jgi:BASS family bile acid:Na+ symporter
VSDFFSDVLQLVTPVFAITSMAAVGMANSFGQILTPLRHWRRVAGALVASFVIVPLLAWALAQLFSLGAPFEAGLILVGCAAGAPFLIKLTQAAGGDLALAAGLLVLLLVGTVIYLPIVLPLALGDDVSVDAAAIAATLIVTMLVPLALGLLLRLWRWDWAGRIGPVLNLVSTVALILIISSTMLAYYDGILDIFGERVILAAFLLMVGAFLSGYWLGGRRPLNRGVVGLATGQRNIAAATVVATQNFDNPDTVVTVVVTSLVGMAVLFPAAWGLRRWTGARATESTPAARRRAA